MASLTHLHIRYFTLDPKSPSSESNFIQLKSNLLELNWSPGPCGVCLTLQDGLWLSQGLCQTPLRHLPHTDLSIVACHHQPVTVEGVPGEVSHVDRVLDGGQARVR